jgi:hypothetical protein
MARRSAAVSRRSSTPTSSPGRPAGTGLRSASWQRTTGAGGPPVRALHGPVRRGCSSGRPTSRGATTIPTPRRRPGGSRSGGRSCAPRSARASTAPPWPGRTTATRWASASSRRSTSPGSRRSRHGVGGQHPVRAGPAAHRLGPPGRRGQQVGRRRPRRGRVLRPQVGLPVDGPAGRHLRAVRRGEAPLDEVVGRLEEAEDELRRLRSASHLPEQPDRAWVDGWLHRSCTSFWAEELGR